MGRLAVVGGNATERIDLGGAGWTALERHGESGYVLPHRIDHGAHMRALAEAGCDRVLAFGSVGGLQPQLGPGTFLCPDDFVALQVAVTTLSGAEAHRIAGFDRRWRAEVAARWTELAEAPLVDGGVYWQAVGPRLETPAEIRMIARDADVIGMTLGSECVVAGELGLAYAAICVVDNYANGVAEEELTIGQLEANRAANQAELARILEALLPALA